jgi:hypothetical protein
MYRPLPAAARQEKPGVNIAKEKYLVNENTGEE